MKFNINLIITFVLATSVTFESSAQYKWSLRKTSDGIDIYTSPVKGSSYNVFKAVSTVTASSLKQIATILLDYENYSDLYPDTRNNKLVKKYNDGHIIHYMRTRAPWPVDDRDGVYELKTTYAKDGIEFEATIRCIEGHVPVNKGVVRMTDGSGFWKVKKVSEESFEITYQYHVEAGGNVPAWIANAASVSIPLRTMKNLKKILSTGKYD